MMTSLPAWMWSSLADLRAARAMAGAWRVPDTYFRAGFSALESKPFAAASSALPVAKPAHVGVSRARIAAAIVLDWDLEMQRSIRAEEWLHFASQALGVVALSSSSFKPVASSVSSFWAVALPW